MIEYREETKFAWKPRVLSIGIHAALVVFLLGTWYFHTVFKGVGSTLSISSSRP